MGALQNMFLLGFQEGSDGHGGFITKEFMYGFRRVIFFLLEELIVYDI